MKTKLLITVLFASLLICFFAFSVSAACLDEHSYEYQVELSEEGFFGEITINGVCTATKCYSKTTEKISPIFIHLGYSRNENGYAQGYVVNRESLAKYEKFSGDSLEFGAVTTTVSVIGKGNPLDKDGNPISEKVIVCDFTSTDYTFIDVSVKGIPNAFKNEGIVCSLYVKSRGSITYLDNAVEKTSRGARSYNDVKAGVQKEEPSRKEHIVIDGVSYRQLDMSFAKGAFWSSGSLSASGSDLNKKFWAAAVPLSPDDLPVGSIVLLDCENYWQYRIDKDATRGTNTKQSVLVIDEDWWGTAKTASFTLSMHKTENASSSPSVDLSGYTESDLKNALKIYVPATETVSEEKTYTKQDWDDDGALKVLLIGNSFSQDTCYHSYQAAKAMGIEDVKIANLYIGAGSISDHIYRHKQGATATFQQSTSKGGWETTSATLETAVKSDDWDFIVLQQVSSLSGEAYSFESVNALIDIVEPLCPSARLGWNMTWAYQSTFDDARFDSYDRDQTKMYQAIVSATKSKIATNDRIEIIVPTGTVIQNVRTSYIGDTLTRDGYHLNESLGRQISSLALVHILTGVSIDGVNTTNYNKITDENALVVAVEAIKNATKAPFEVTESQYKDESEAVPPENPDVNEGGDNTGDGTGGDNTGNEGADTPSTEISGYTQLTVSEMEVTRGQYYNSGNGTISKGTDVCYPGYYTIKKFTKETLPVGSKIFLAAGWQYRLIIKDENGKYSNNYVKTNEDIYVEITEEWWSDRAEICFTVSAKDHAYGKVPTTDLTAEEVGTSKFIIYIPVFSN
ncbi:MAG: DUF4886 domain-containing protein [Clostridia bacterium]|nr:DUF4886 domain-containing protein [Clostridia bacterium]